MLPALIEIEHRQLHVHRLSASIEGYATLGTVIVGYHSDAMGKHVVVALQQATAIIGLVSNSSKHFQPIDC